LNNKPESKKREDIFSFTHRNQELYDDDDDDDDNYDIDNDNEEQDI